MKTQCPLLAAHRLSEGGDKSFFLSFLVSCKIVHRMQFTALHKEVATEHFADLGKLNLLMVV